MLRFLLIALFTFTLTLGGPFSENSAVARGKVPDLRRDGLPNLVSASAFVIDIDTRRPLIEKDADTLRPVASLSKLLATLVIISECGLPLDGTHVMSVANRDAAKGGDKSKLITGWSYTHRDLLYAALMRSDNRALPALGESCGMTTDEFGRRMTERTRKMGLTLSQFMEPNGLSKDNTSTAREFSTVLMESLNISLITEILTTPRTSITGQKNNMKRTLEIRNTDLLLHRDQIKILGGKTGYTDIARYCFAGGVILPTEHKIGMVFLGAEGKQTRFADFMRAYKWLASLPTPSDIGTTVIKSL